jgi:hypothetical protein
VPFPDMDSSLGPALVTQGGDLEMHGAPLSRTWVKLGTTGRKGAREVELSEPVTGWRVGDRVLLTSTAHVLIFVAGPYGPGTGDAVVANGHSTSEDELRRVTAIHGRRVALDPPLEFEHYAEGEFRGEVANLSRNVVVESADPERDGGKWRGHDLFHRGSLVHLGYAEFRHLGKPGVLGRYPLHFHQPGDTGRGSYVLGASIWDSRNRWLTLHGTQYLVVRDCVGYRSVGHGFFLEDGTEEDNILDRNLGVLAQMAEPPSGQVLGYDQNDGAVFWWANSRNSFTRNVAVEGDQYGYRFEVVKSAAFDPVIPVRQPDGSLAPTDLRTIPFIRFDGNEAHSMRRFGFNLGGVVSLTGKFKGPENETASHSLAFRSGDVGGVGPDRLHPFVVRDLKVWRADWCIHIGSPSVWIDGLSLFDSTYGIFRSNLVRHQYRNVSIAKMDAFAMYNPFGNNQSPELSFEDDLAEPLVDDAPPLTVVTDVIRERDGSLLVRGSTADNGTITEVRVNDHAATLLPDGEGQWQARFAPDEARELHSLMARSSDLAGNIELTPHVIDLARMAPAVAAAR